MSSSWVISRGSDFHNARYSFQYVLRYRRDHSELAGFDKLKNKVPVDVLSLCHQKQVVKVNANNRHDTVIVLSVDV